MRFLVVFFRKIVGCLSFFCNKKIATDVMASRKRLMSFSAKPDGVCHTENAENLSYDLQIIIPAYNVGKYITKCLDSLKSCVYGEYSVLVEIIDDGSTDETGKIIDRFANEFDGNVSVVRQENSGLSMARNTGLNTLVGEYVLFIDSDDFLPNGLRLDYLMDAMKGKDVLQGGWEVVNDEDCVISSNKNVSFAGFAWGKIYHHSVFKSLHFPEKYWFEDTIVKLIIGGMKLRVESVNEIVYCYRINPKGISANSKDKPKLIDTYWITELCYTELPKYGIEYDQAALNRLLRQSIINQIRIRRLPKTIRRDIFALTADLIEKYFKEINASKEYLRLEKALRKRMFTKFELLTLSKIELL